MVRGDPFCCKENCSQYEIGLVFKELNQLVFGLGHAQGYSLIWVIRVRAAGQGKVFWPRYPKQGVKFDLPLS